MKLLEIIPTYKPAFLYGGAVSAVSLLCEALVAENNIQVTVLSTTANGKAELPEFSREPALVDGVPVYYFPRWTKDHSQFSPGLLWWLWRNVKQYDTVHIHSWWNFSVLFATMICIRRGIKPILSPHGMLSPFTLTGRFKPLFHRLMGEKMLKKTVLHVTSNQEAKECLALTPDLVYKDLPNFLDLDTLPLPIKKTDVDVSTKTQNKTFRLLFLSRLHQKKGIELLFNALAEVPFDWSLTMAGDGEADYIAQLKHLSLSLKINNKINWIGWVNTEQRLTAFEAADLFVLTSHNENFAISVIESLVVGIPVLVSQHVGLSDYIMEKKLGWVCDTTIKSIQSALTQAYFEEDERKRIADAGPNQIRTDFARSVLAKRYINMYREVNELQIVKQEKPIVSTV